MTNEKILFFIQTLPNAINLEDAGVRNALA